MIKLVLTDMDGTFLNNQGDYNRELFQQVKNLMSEKGVHFATVTGKQSERVEELLGPAANDFWTLVIAQLVSNIRESLFMSHFLATV